LSKTQDQGLVYRRAFISLDKRLQNFKFLDKIFEGGRRVIPQSRGGEGRDCLEASKRGLQVGFDIRRNPAALLGELEPPKT
jgi:hypothetical protein